MSYQQLAVPQEVKKFTADFSLWTPGQAAGELLLPVDPAFEIAWLEHEGEVVGVPVLCPAQTQVRPLPVRPTPLVRCSLRLKRHWVEGLIRDVPESLVDGEPILLSDLLGRRFSPCCLREELLASLSRVEVEPSLEAKRARAALCLVQTRISLTIQGAAHELGLSYQSLRRAILRATGVHPRIHLGYSRLARAAALSKRFPRESLLGVAIHAGFADDAALAHASQRITGRTFRGLVNSFHLAE